MKKTWLSKRSALFQGLLVGFCLLLSPALASASAEGMLRRVTMLWASFRNSHPQSKINEPLRSFLVRPGFSKGFTESDVSDAVYNKIIVPYVNNESEDFKLEWEERWGRIVEGVYAPAKSKYLNSLTPQDWQDLEDFS